MTTATDPAERAITYAATRGTEDGTAAASWYFDGNTSTDTYAAVLRGIEDGDPAVLDTFPSPDLSGEWADTLTGPALVEAAIVNADDWGMRRDEWTAYWSERSIDTEICDAYEDAFTAAVQAEIERMARAQR